MIGCVRKEAGRPLDQSNDILIKVKGLTKWEEESGREEEEKTKRQEKVNEMDQISFIKLWPKLHLKIVILKSLPQIQK